MELKCALPKDPLSLFLVGVQCRSLSSILKARSIARQMGQMQAELRANPDSGFIWGKGFISFSPFTTLFLSYWTSSAHINRFVGERKFSHIAASKDYLSRFLKNPNIGVWHETYEVEPGKTENLYLGMKPFGMSAVVKSQNLDQSNRAFLQRFGRKNPS